MTATAQDCKQCQKSSLSLLLLRPSPLANDAKLRPAGADKVAADSALVSPFIPPGLTQSKPVLRLLRAGYVHLYIPSRDTDQPKDKPWHTWRVTDEADLLAETHPLFATPSVSSVCCRSGHNVWGFKLLPLPNAHELMGQSIWLAFSANLWSAKLKKQNKANPQAMVEIKLGQAKAPAFKPDEASLRSQVLECNAPDWRLRFIEANLQPQFAYNSMCPAQELQDMVGTLKKAAAGHPKTTGQELAVVLPDPVGYAAELNAMRLMRHELTKQTLTDSADAHPLMSLTLLDGLRQSVIDEQHAKSFDAVSPVMDAGLFKLIMRTTPNPRGWPEGTRWEPIVSPRHQGQTAALGTHMGRVVFPDHEARAQRWAIEATERHWQKRYADHLDLGRLNQWKSDFAARLKKTHGDAQTALEQDWMAALHHARVADYLRLHFDDTAVQCFGSAQDHSAGEAHAKEVAAAWGSPPLSTEKAVQQPYAAQLCKKPDDADAWMWHALLGNQAELKRSVSQYLLDERQDKLHDLGSALFTSLKEGEVVHPSRVKYNWLTRAGFAAASLTITQSWGALIAASTPVVAAAGGGAGGAAAGLSPVLEQRIRAAMNVSRTVAMAADSALQQTALRRPLLVEIELSLQQARELMAQRRQTGADAVSNTQLKRMAAQHSEGLVRLQLATDTVDARAAGVSAQDLAASGVGTLTAGKAARAAAAAAPAGALRVNEAVFAKLVQSSANWQKKAMSLTEELGRSMPGVTLTLEGQIGLLSVMINGMGLASSYQKWQKSGSALDFVNATDAFFGLVAGSAQVAEAAWAASLTHRLGEQAAKRAVSVAMLQAVGSVAGAASGFAMSVGQGIKTSRAARQGDVASAYAYGLSAGTSLGFTATSTIVAWGAVARVMNKRLGAQGALWRGAARARLANIAVRRVSTSLGLRAVGGAALGLTGWGLILLALTLTAEVVAISLSPSAIQSFVRRSYFGKADKADRYDSLEQEYEAVEALAQGIHPDETARQARQPQSISELGPMP